jgi:hypothetical protein
MLATRLGPGPGFARAIHAEALGEMPKLVGPGGAPMRRFARGGARRGPLVRRGLLPTDDLRTGAMVFVLVRFARGIDELVTVHTIARGAVAPVGVVRLAAALGGRAPACGGARSSHGGGDGVGPFAVTGGPFGIVHSALSLLPGSGPSPMGIAGAGTRPRTPRPHRAAPGPRFQSGDSRASSSGGDAASISARPRTTRPFS